MSLDAKRCAELLAKAKLATMPHEWDEIGPDLADALRDALELLGSTMEVLKRIDATERTLPQKLLFKMLTEAGIE